MTNDEFEKRRDFILEQQAQFAADIQELREAQTQTGEIVARLAHVTLEGFKDVNVKINALVDSQIRTDEKVNALADSQKQTDVKINALVESQNALVESQMDTHESLRNLMAVVNRHLSEGHNGN